ncbi:MAG TPA: gamma-glutamylcyclotransferase [Cyanobacteria bacterium UBA8803]|nr:gamma-glutamylcyclotransferase [Cyanobacteria bacterium UBA9273]HBL57317.1 gamma-glutamylcyclotransferase [Cyanobacteria bacterium UBA8803]
MRATSSELQEAPTQFFRYSQQRANVKQLPQIEPSFYYFAYGSCMCPVDLKRSLGENTHAFVIGPASLKDYRLGFYRKSQLRNCGVLDMVPDPTSTVEGVLYRLPWRLSEALDKREEVPQGGYRREAIAVHHNGRLYQNVRTYVVVDKLAEELAPNDWYFNVVLRGAITCGLPESYCWQLFNHMYKLQQRY